MDFKLLTEISGLEEILKDGLSQDAFEKKGMPPIEPFGISMEAPDKKVVGGITGVIMFGSLYIDLLWIDPAKRRNGWGTKLLQEAEKIGREKGCSFAYLTTMDWEALPFYQKLGYQIEFVRPGFLKNSKMYCLRKEFSAID